jgi:hypothetical protein
MRSLERHVLPLLGISLLCMPTCAQYRNTTSVIASSVDDTASRSVFSLPQTSSAAETGSHSPLSPSETSSTGIPDYILQGLAVSNADSTASSAITGQSNTTPSPSSPSIAWTASSSASSSEGSTGGPIATLADASQTPSILRLNQTLALANGPDSSNATIPGTRAQTTSFYGAIMLTTVAANNTTYPSLPATGSGSAYASLCNAELLAWSSLAFAATNVPWTTSWFTNVNTYTNWSVQITTLGGCDTRPRVDGSFTSLVGDAIRISHPMLILWNRIRSRVRLYFHSTDHQAFHCSHPAVSIL